MFPFYIKKNLIQYIYLRFWFFCLKERRGRREPLWIFRSGVTSRPRAGRRARAAGAGGGDGDGELGGELGGDPGGDPGGDANGL